MQISIYAMSDESIDSVDIDGEMAKTSQDEKWLIIYGKPDDDEEDENSIVTPLQEVGRFKWDSIVGYAMDEY